MDALLAVPPAKGMLSAACAALGLSRASLHRRRGVLGGKPAPQKPKAKPARVLSEDERQGVLALLHEPRFVDLAPTEIYATLLDEGTYHCSVRTMYRLLAEHGEVRERRNQLRHPVYQKPELIAERPNEVWSWDITKLMGPAKWTYFYLYVIIDIFSRRIVGWCVADTESATLFKPLIEKAINSSRDMCDTIDASYFSRSSTPNRPMAAIESNLPRSAIPSSQPPPCPPRDPTAYPKGGM
jgi:transposase InsO family protein